MKKAWLDRYTKVPPFVQFKVLHGSLKGSVSSQEYVQEDSWMSHMHRPMLGTGCGALHDRVQPAVPNGRNSSIAFGTARNHRAQEQAEEQ